MKRSIDQQQDYSHKELYQYLKGKPIPDFVKEAELDDFDSFQNLPKTAFADPLNRLFPINSKARVYTSNAYFVNKQAALKDLWGKRYVDGVAANIQKAAEVFGINNDLREYVKTSGDESNADKKNEYNQSSNSITVKLGEDEIELFNFTSASGVKRAADEFVHNLDHYPFEWRRDIANKLVKSAEKFELDELPDLVCKYAGLFYPEVTSIKDEIKRRATKLASADNVLIYCEMAKDCDNITSHDDVFKVAETLYFTEKMEGLYNKPKTAKLLGDPIDKLFPIDFNKVAEMLDVVKMGDEMFDRNVLASVPSSIFEQAFGCEINPKSAEDTDVLATMPRADVSLFKQLSGVKPI